MTAVLVRGDNGTTPPTVVPIPGGGWTLEGGTAQAAAQLGSNNGRDGYVETSSFYINDPLHPITGINRLEPGDHYLPIEVATWTAHDTPGNTTGGIYTHTIIDKWDSEWSPSGPDNNYQKLNARGVSDDGEVAYNYYMFIFLTDTDGNSRSFEKIDTANGLYYDGAYHELLYSGVPEIQKNALVSEDDPNTFFDAVTVRFSLSNPVPEPTAAALLALGAACLGLRRRRPV